MEYDTFDAFDKVYIFIVLIVLFLMIGKLLWII